MSFVQANTKMFIRYAHHGNKLPTYGFFTSPYKTPNILDRGIGGTEWSRYILNTEMGISKMFCYNLRCRVLIPDKGPDFDLRRHFHKYSRAHPAPHCLPRGVKRLN